MSWILDAWNTTLELVPQAVQAGVLSAAACAAAGVLLRWRRLIWAGFAVPEAATVGTALALGSQTLWSALGFAGAVPPLLTNATVLVGIATAIPVLWLIPIGRAARRGGERAAAACFLLAATLVVLLVSESPHGTEEVRALATGKTLLFLGADDVTILAWAMPPLACFAVLLAPALAALAFDRDHARAAGRPVVALEAGVAVGLGALIALLSPRTGAPFVFAYLTIPAAAAERVAARPRSVVVASLLVGVLGFLVGAVAAVRWDLPFSTAAIAGVLGVGGLLILAALGVSALASAGP